MRLVAESLLKWKAGGDILMSDCSRVTNTYNFHPTVTKVARHREADKVQDTAVAHFVFQW
jgi:hypothetical protein